MLELISLFQRASFKLEDNRLQVYVDGRLAAEVTFHDEKLLRAVVKALRNHGKL
ncbi:hypothetical protein [Infirmifilum sp. NZ]|uniref:hypothetical protein n=1 Tax=Infirmifilum sp. NZ TaxID=2926850 RepID=UPI00279E1742|nr:hypothetical protein [Infirmifilum sp. NZ]UNQ73558.1 hypothetical protein MOV14_00745 [Infirmifilum sp. NZ]